MTADQLAYPSPEPGFGQLFVVGAPRSGTTWLQRLLGAHPEIASGQETGLFAAYLRPWVRQWERQLPEDREHWRRQRHRGLPALLEVEQFEGLLAQVVEQVYGQLVKLKPGARYVLDKDPGNALVVDLILRICPSARVLHIIRDGRDVTASMVAAGRSWGGAWAPEDLMWAAEAWQRYVRTAREAGRRTDRYLEVRYEDLLTRGVDVLAECFEFCDIAVSRSECERLFAAAAFRRDAANRPPPDPLLWSGEVVRRLGGPPDEPEGFYREGRAGGWRESWTPLQALTFSRTAGGLLVELGYEPDEAWARASVGTQLAVAGMRGYRHSRRRLANQIRRRWPTS